MHDFTLHFQFISWCFDRLVDNASGSFSHLTISGLVLRHCPCPVTCDRGVTVWGLVTVSANPYQSCCCNKDLKNLLLKAEDPMTERLKAKVALPVLLCKTGWQ